MEHTYGLLRQYFPKGTDLSGVKSIVGPQLPTYGYVSAAKRKQDEKRIQLGVCFSLHFYGCVAGCLSILIACPTWGSSYNSRWWLPHAV